MTETRNRYQILVGKPEGKCKINIDLREIVILYVLFICSLFNDAFSVIRTIQRRMKGMMNWKGRRKKHLWHNLRYSPGIFWRNLVKPRKSSVRIAGLRADI
jgi:hypothetical protein